MDGGEINFSVNIKSSQAEKDIKKIVEETKTRIKGALMNIRTGFATMAKVVAGLAAVMGAALLKALTTYIGKSLTANKEYVKSLEQMKAAIATLAAPIMQIVVPALIKLIQIATLVFSVFASIASILTGGSFKQSADNAEALEKEKKAIDGVGKAAKKNSKYLASFDEINQIGDKNGGGGASKIGYDFSGIDEMRDKVIEFEAFLGGALLALGVVLLFTGHPILGAACIAAGVLALVSATMEAQGDVTEEIKTKLETLMTFIALFALAIGVVLLFTGHIALGIALILIGVATMVSAAAVRWGEVEDSTKQTLISLLQVCATALLALGVILIFTGQIPLGIALIVAGALMWFQALALDWNATKDKVQTIMADILKIVGAAIAVLGVIMLLLGHPAIGLAMIIAGVAIFAVGTQVANWDSMPEQSKKTLMDILVLAGLFVTALGVILLFAGLVPLGLGMIVGGIGILGVGTLGAKWDFIPSKIKEIWESVKNYYNIYIKKYLTAEYWAEKAKSILNGFKNGFTGLGSLFSSIGSGIAGIFTGNAKAPSVSRAAVPALASGAVIPPNKKFLAMLGDQTSGTNIEAPLATIEQALENVIARTNGNGNQKVILTVGDEVFGELSYRLGNRYASRVGVDVMEG